MPWGCPFFVRGVVQVYEAGGDEGIYPGAGVCVAVSDIVSGKQGDWEIGCERMGVGGLTGR